MEEDYHLKSMTAYGRGISSFSTVAFTIEIQSVNRRHLEINITLPKPLARFEMELRKKIAALVARGAISVSVFWQTADGKKICIRPNIAMAKALKQAWDLLSQELELHEQIPVALLLQEKELFLYDEEIVQEELYAQALNSALSDALESFSAMKRKEGAALAADLKGRLFILNTKIVEIEALSHHSAEKYRQKLTQRLEELFEGKIENEERVLREVAIFAERADITEEIVRLKGHLAQFEHLMYKPLENELEARGKTLDFLVQELHREINTIGSKASDLLVAQLVIGMKSELEKIREQVQNIE